MQTLVKWLWRKVNKLASFYLSMVNLQQEKVTDFEYLLLKTSTIAVDLWHLKDTV